MTLDEGIKNCEEIAEDQDILCKRCDDASGYSRSHNESIRTSEAKKYEKCSQDFRQIVGWLRELKTYKEQEQCNDAISREELLKNQTVIVDDDGLAHKVVHIGRICAAPSVIPTRGTCKDCRCYEKKHNITPKQKQEPILDKIRAEILSKPYEGYELGGFRDGYNTALVNVLNTLDKYKAESEDEE